VKEVIVTLTIDPENTLIDWAIGLADVLVNFRDAIGDRFSDAVADEMTQSLHGAIVDNVLHTRTIGYHVEKEEV